MQTGPLALSINEPHTQTATASLPLAITVIRFVRAQLPILSTFVEDQAVMIVEEFKALSAQTMEHGEHLARVIEIAAHIELQGEVVPYEKSVEILYEPLAEAIEKILDISKLSMAMVMNIGNAADNIARVEECIVQVQALTKQTNMLAMNTQIEAARTGETGRSFRIIAQEVKALSERIKNVSGEIHNEVKQVSVSVRKSRELVDSLAHYDMTENLALRDRIDELIQSIVKQNQHFSELLHDASDRSKQTANSIQQLIIGIQFQDRTSQVMADLGRLLDHVTEILEAIEQELPAEAAVNEAMIADITSNLQLSEVRKQALQHFLEAGMLTPAMGLYTETNATKASINGNSVSELFEGNGEANDDDIELF